MFFSKTSAHNGVHKLVLTAMFAACYVVLEFISAHTTTTKFSLAFIAMAVAAYTLGPVGAAIAVGIGDMLQAMLIFGIGQWIPELTLTMMLMAVASGILLKGMFGLRRLPMLLRVVILVLFTEWICGFLLNSFWLWLRYSNGRTYWAMAVSRIPQEAILTAVKIPAIYALGKLNDRVFSKVLKA